VLPSDAKADQACGDSTEERHSVEQAEHERHLVELRLAQDQRRQHAIVDESLRALDDLCRKHSPLLNLLQQRVDVFSARQRSGKDVGCGDGVLDREVDPDSADRRHGMGRIADREEAWPPPARQSVQRDRK